MHPNPIYRGTPSWQNITFARERAFGVLSINGDDTPLLAHVPFLLSEDGKTAQQHLVRSNPIARALKTEKPAVIAIMGPDSYISPDWYGPPDQVPTWNYIAVHLRGHIRLLPQDDLPGLLDRQSAHFEEQLTPKTPWTIAKMTPDVRDRLMRQIVPCEMTITAIDGSWKMNQNKPDTVRHAAANMVDGYGIGSETRILAALMHSVPDTDPGA